MPWPSLNVGPRIVGLLDSGRKPGNIGRSTGKLFLMAYLLRICQYLTFAAGSKLASNLTLSAPFNNGTLAQYVLRWLPLLSSHTTVDNSST